jgi:hypothetical protein
MNPDGSNLELLYGKQSHDTGPDGDTIQFTQPRQLEDGRVMALIRPFTDSEGGGELITIDTIQYLENTQPTAPNIGVLAGPAQEDATINEVLTQAGPSPGGRYGSAYPIQDGTGRLLVSWSQCRLIEVTEDFAAALRHLDVRPARQHAVAGSPRGRGDHGQRGGCRRPAGKPADDPRRQQRLSARSDTGR